MYILTIDWVDRHGQRIFTSWKCDSPDFANYQLGQFRAFNPMCYRGHTVTELAQEGK